MAKSSPPTTGQFKKGDGRQRGPPPLPAEVREAFRAASREALDTLLAVMARFNEGDESVPASAAVSAATAVLDRGYGKPASSPEDLEALTSGAQAPRDLVIKALRKITGDAD